MSAPIIQIHSLILPAAWTLETSIETVDDLLEHTSLEVDIRHLQEKTIHIQATEVLTAGIPGPLWLWVELAPFNATYAAWVGLATTLWSAIGGGGGAIAPVAPVIEVATGVNGTVHTLHIPWATHSRMCRLVVQTPVSAAIATAWWTVQARLEGKGP